MESKFKPGSTPEGKIPAFVKYDPCPMCDSSGIMKCPICNGRGWKRERNGYRLLVCPMCSGDRRVVCRYCRGQRKLPRSNVDGGWEKR